MPRFDAHRRADGPGFLLDVQSGHLFGLPTRMVVPLQAEAGPLPPIRDLNPVLAVGGERVTMMTQYMAAIPRSLLGPPVANLFDQADDITRALDILLTGF
jgi:toxin CcdB